MEFFDLVEKMRALQKEYFKFRDGRILSECKNLERQVDEYIIEEKKEIERYKHQELF